ncbi:hypothetical protein DPMN_035622 [Dreissena polymorpha]|uniref:Macro domain-containing protein n=1 Tax=Dreissena polymorpha TaxID=45954 RepID=A0A9D4MA06_DREPO|nr:hypothetical protein DPMN_035622 [Dreissena polymorpha]
MKIQSRWKGLFISNAIVLLQTDILVFCTSPKLNLKGGPATQALLKAGGQQLQTDCDRLYPKGIKEGELAIIGGGQLKCEQIYLTTLPTWKEASSNGCKVSSVGLCSCNQFEVLIPICVFISQ